MRQIFLSICNAYAVKDLFFSVNNIFFALCNNIFTSYKIVLNRFATLDLLS